MKKETLARATALVAWIVCILLWINFNLWQFFAGLFVLHAIELFVKAIPIGRKAGIHFTTILFMNMVFGITWWRPVERRTLNRV